ncbi:hypothetical protein ABBQ38_001729 [Trebouxia sp. C0009 RCD-2024]
MPWDLQRHLSCRDRAVTREATSSLHKCMYQVVASAVGQALWAVTPTAQRSPHPPAEDVDYLLDFEQIDIVGDNHPEALDGIIAWLEKMVSTIRRLTVSSHVGPVSSTDLLEPAVQPRHLSHLRISPLWQMFIQHSDAEIGQQLYPPATPPTPAKQESHAKHASKASRSASRSGSTSSVPRSSGSRSGSPPGSSSEPGAGQLETAGPVLDWLYGLKTFHHELPRLPGMAEGVQWAWAQLKKILEHVDTEAAKLDNVQTILKSILHFRQEVMEYSRNGGLRPGDEGLQPLVMLCLLRQERVLAEAEKSIASDKYNAAATNIFKLNQKISIGEMEQKQAEALQYATAQTYNDIETNLEGMPEENKQACARVLKRDRTASTAEVQERKEAVARYKRRLQEEKAMYWEQDAVLTELDAWTAKTHDMCERITVLLPHLEASYSRRPDAAQRVLATLQKQFHKDFEPKFRSHQQDETIFKELSAQAKRMAHRDDTGAAVVELLVQLLAEAACNDPTAVLLSEVMLPVCRERLEAAAGFKEATIMRFEIWTESTWPPAFAKTVQGYQARIYSTHAPDEFQASGFSSLIGIIAVDLRRRFAGKLAYGAYVDDILLEQCNHNPEADVEFLSHEDKGLCNTVLAGVFQKPRTKWMACLCCGSM